MAGALKSAGQHIEDSFGSTVGGMWDRLRWRDDDYAHIRRSRFGLSSRPRGPQMGESPEQ